MGGPPDVQGDGPEVRIDEALDREDLDLAVELALGDVVARAGAVAGAVVEAIGGRTWRTTSWPGAPRVVVPAISPGELDVAARTATGVPGATVTARALGGPAGAALVLGFDAAPAPPRAADAAVRTLALVVRARRAERAQAAAERERDALMQHAADAIFITDPNLTILDVNERACAVLGRTEEELRSKRIEDLVVPDELQASPLMKRELRAGAPTYTRRTFVLPDGGLRQLEVSAARIDEGRFLGIARDVTERRRAEEQLARSEATFRALIEQAPDAILVHRHGRIVYVNPAMVRMMRWERADQLVGRDVLSIIHPDDRAMVTARVAAMQRGTGQLPSLEERLVRADGEVISVEVAALGVVFEGEPAVVAVGRDVTERKRLESRLALADRMAAIGQLSAGVAHEINNPLTYVLLHLDTLRGRFVRSAAGGASVDPHAALQAIEQSLDGLRRVRTIVRDLRTFGRSDEPVAAIDVRTAIEMAARLASHELKHQARLELTLPEPVPVHGREGRLCQLFLNLLVNAAQAFEARPGSDNVVAVTTRLTGDQVEIEVRDNGPGIPAEVRSRVFEPFFTTKPTGAGSGLGLAICRDIVVEHGGRIALDSVEGVGTRFVVSLPLARDVTAPTAARAAAPRGARVLVVDDEISILDAIAAALGDEHTVVRAVSGEAALARIAVEPEFDVILCDQRMPGMTGLELHERLRRERPLLAARFVLMSSVSPPQPGLRFLAKPFSAAALAACVVSVWRREATAPPR